VYSSNLTPSAQGLGGWSEADFYRALHHGQSRNGRWLYPAFPFPNTTHISRADSDALFAYLQTVPASNLQPPVHQLRWPYNTQAALKVWRLLYFREGEPLTLTSPSSTPAASVQRGAYLVNGLGHCSACHAPRNALGGHSDPLSLHGGLMPVTNWYAPSLHNPAEGGVQHWAVADTVALLRDGRNHTAVATGPMAEVVQHSSQHWQEADLQSVALYLQQLPSSGQPLAAAGSAPRPAAASTTSARQGVGERLYTTHCASCHGDLGEGMATPNGQPAYPPLAGNRAVELASPANLVHMVLNGGFGPSTRQHPRPFGMPPYMLVLSDPEVAALLTHIRTAWGNQASPVSELDVQRLRGGLDP
jgi:mono/diheme cytochrome c family protein